MIVTRPVPPEARMDGKYLWVPYSHDPEYCPIGEQKTSICGRVLRQGGYVWVPYEVPTPVFLTNE